MDPLPWGDVLDQGSRVESVRLAVDRDGRLREEQR
jgi:hypothetical protein